MTSRRMGAVGRLTAACLFSLALGGLVLGCGGPTLDSGEFLPSPTSGGGDQLVKKVVLVPFTSTVTAYTSYSLALGHKLAKDLGQLPGVRLEDYEQLRSRAQQTAAPGSTPMQGMLLAGRALGVNSLVQGAVVDISVQRDLTGVYGFRENTPFLSLEAQLSLLDVTSGTLLAETSIRREEEISDVQAEAVSMGEKMPADVLAKLQAELEKGAWDWLKDEIGQQRWSGLVTKVEAGRVEINAGSEHGLSSGFELAVYSVGEAIKTGAGRVVYLPGPRVGAIRLKEVQAGSSWGEVVSQAERNGKKAALSPGQVVVLP